jgi:hypothetical protein
MGIQCPKCHHNNLPDTVFCTKCATPLPDSVEISHTKTLKTPIKELTRGTTFAGRYEIIEELGVCRRTVSDSFADFLSYRFLFS